jgi:hypothetical protein
VSQGIFIISLDFELFWGVKDHRTIASYGKAILGGRTAIVDMLDVFAKEKIHATWAIVGMLMYDNKKELVKGLPDKKPQYRNSLLSNYKGLEEVGADETSDAYHFGKTLVDKIVHTPYQEVASHTFSHYYCLEEGQSKEDFQADTSAWVERCRQLSIKPQSIVFPRNQYNLSYLSVLKVQGFSSFRGNESHRLYEARSRAHESTGRRVMRLLDSYLNLSGHHTYGISDLEKEEGMLNIPASRFLRPYHAALSFLEQRKISRIKKSMKHAAQKGEIFHLWWHPHNFGTHPEQMMKQLREIVAYYKILEKKYNMKSLTMSEVAKEYNQLGKA